VVLVVIHAFLCTHALGYVIVVLHQDHLPLQSIDLVLKVGYGLLLLLFASTDVFPQLAINHPGRNLRKNHRTVDLTLQIDGQIDHLVIPIFLVELMIHLLQVHLLPYIWKNNRKIPILFKLRKQIPILKIMSHTPTLPIALLLALLALASPQCLSYYEYYDFNTGACLPCGASCLSCFDAVVCTQCVPQYFMSNNVCSKCSFGCAVCTNATSCSTCNDGLYLTNSGTCSACSTGVATCTLATVQSCQEGYFMLGSICAGCLTNCKTCADFVTCTTCSLGYYLAASGNSCLNCPSNCRICTSSTSCSECGLGYTQNATGCAPFSCSSLDPFCTSCANGQCLSCQAGKYLSAGSCLQGGSLLCLEATGPYYTNCVTSSYGCQSYSVVQTQSGSQLSVCLPMSASKTNEYIYLTPTFTCSGTCSTPNTVSLSYSTSQTYYTLSFYINARFYSNTASRSITASLTSQNGSVLATTNIAVDITQELSTYSQTDVQCLGCIYGEKVFSGTVTYSAGQYPTNFTFKDSAGQMQVVEALFDHAACQVSQCSQCNSAVDCTACFSPYYLQISSCLSACDTGFYLYGQTCYLSCPSGTYTLTSSYTCQPCLAPCLTCSSQTACLSCTPSYYLEGTTCLTACSTTALFPNATSLACEACPNPCVTCQLLNSSVLCLSCSAGYLLSNGSCTYICPWG
jgi:hypothetical protein